MFASRHKAVVAGLALSLSLGGVVAPKALATPPQAEDKVGDSGDAERLPEPAGRDRAELYREEKQGPFASLLSLFSARSSLAPVSLSDEMKYFCQFESAQNYDQGFSYGDGYNAMGYYQFDRRSSLVDFMRQAYNYDPATYSMFVEVLEYAKDLENENVSMYDYDTKRLTKVGQLADDAWHAAYAADPAEFSALQDSYAYENYYVAVEDILRETYGVDIADRADCVKGLAWGMCNLFGSGGVQWFFDRAVEDSELSDTMSDREVVEALTDAVINHIKTYAPGQPEYWNGWINRYRQERATCLSYISEDEQQTPKPEPEPEPAPDEPGNEAPGDEVPDSETDTSTDDEPSGGDSTGDASDENGTDNGTGNDAPSGDDTDGDDSDTDKPSDNRPSDETPDADGSTDDEPTDDAPTDDESAGDEQAGDTTPSKPQPSPLPPSNGAVTGGGSGNEDSSADKNESDEQDETDNDASTTPPTNSNGGSQNSSDDDKNESAAKTFTVTFKVKGLADKTVKVEEGETVAKPTDVAQFEGYKFAGWYLEVDGEVDTEQAFDFSTPIKRDTTLVACYTEKKVEKKDEGEGKDPEQKAAEAKQLTASPKGLPQTGDMSSIFTAAAAGAALAGTSLTALGIRRRKQS